MKTEHKSESNKNMLVAFAITLVVIALVALAGFLFLRPAEPLIEGQADADEVRISSKVPGRIEEIRVSEGQTVRAGDTLGRLSIPAVMAKKAQADAARAAGLKF